MTLDTLVLLAIALCLLVGLVFTLVAAIGLLKLDDPMTRLHAPTKAGTLGTGSFLLAAMIHALATGGSALHELLIMAFLFVTAPVSANFLARVNIHQSTCAPPPAPPGETWSTLDVPEADRDIEAGPPV
ncbi:monovalent cation/H(+) antiporter subunit G [Jannaschia sp. W003]|uniref:monovalent cation/H(+) antiporter subunit G n=1 Tax=Jannaschia sp. W003 TaxID=2867012 RepID=UPI0021A506E7|nr:monovalent cation/H(+) antiporter subunit G [Jannaschia sp. W003]UWQ21910.1 monovalent cation/H(+) antiporter subunit G [Jannaschia sp. W003]